jgi:hypothetical protein
MRENRQQVTRQKRLGYDVGMSTDQVQVFGNTISPKRVAQGVRLRERFARKYGYVEGLKYPLSASENPTVGPFIGVHNVVSRQGGAALDPEKGVLVGTIRMGYGHYRIAMALASAVHSMGLIPYWFDLLGFDSPGARMIRDMDKWYSLGSRVSQKSRLFNRLLWDPLMGKWYKRLEKNYPVMAAAALFSDVYGEIPKDMPFLASHPFAAHGALHAGLKRVVNVIPDNCPLGFHLSAGGIQTVQSPSAYFGFRTLKGMGGRGQTPHGVPAAQLAMTGHYIDHELAANAVLDCEARMTRIQAKAPRRLLISVGGAGAQQGLIAAVLGELMPRLRDKSVTLFINFGDHGRIYDAVMKAVPGARELATHHTDWIETAWFAERAAEDDLPGGLHTFLNNDIYAAVYTTNLLMRASDVLLTKPSELAYYPIPKLFLERVGGHEAWGAIRASELGDGTQECGSIPITLQTLRLLIEEDDLLSMLCDGIIKLDGMGVYHGAYRAVELALD